MRNRKHEAQYHIMLMPGMILLLIFSFVPMFGFVIAFQKFSPAMGIFRSPWVGLSNFRYMLQLPDTYKIIRNTVTIAVSKIALGITAPLLFALALNEVRSVKIKRVSQTIVYLPHFLSWVILGGIVLDIFSLGGIVNQVITWFGGDRVMFMASNRWFRPIVLLSHVWKEFGFGAIIYLAAITNVNPQLYEAAVIDGAGRFQSLWKITLPCILPTVILMATLALGNILNAGFDQIFNLYNPLVYETGDIIDTYLYRVAFENAQYGLSTAVGLTKSAVGMVMIVTSYWLAGKFANYRIF